MSESKFKFLEILQMLKPYDIVSVNTSSLFDGSLYLLKRVRKQYPKKFLIRKDFIMIPKQVKESKESGADAVLIIKTFLNVMQYDKLIDSCKKENIIPITEVNKDLLFRMRGEAILINSRNLNTGNFDIDETEELCKRLRDGEENVIYASGENSDRVIKEGIADAVLIGAAFMRGELE